MRSPDREPTDHEREDLSRDVRALAETWARRLSIPAARSTGREHVDLVRALGALTAAIESETARRVTDAREAGVGDRRLGAAWGISKQGAAKKWPRPSAVARRATRVAPSARPVDVGNTPVDPPSVNPEQEPPVALSMSIEGAWVRRRVDLTQTLGPGHALVHLHANTDREWRLLRGRESIGRITAWVSPSGRVTGWTACDDRSTPVLPPGRRHLWRTPEEAAAGIVARNPEPSLEGATPLAPSGTVAPDEGCSTGPARADVGAPPPSPASALPVAGATTVAPATGVGSVRPVRRRVRLHRFSPEEVERLMLVRERDPDGGTVWRAMLDGRAVGRVEHAWRGARRAGWQAVPADSPTPAQRVGANATTRQEALIDLAEHLVQVGLTHE
ncbi:hypothetical protein [Embleya sp. MST-111070]|uniref:hypothetical protein n=1 Tax=Embleya sp. MST-111070 TaxID=3398231 RepID=UPI003F73C761